MPGPDTRTPDQLDAASLDLVDKGSLFVFGDRFASLQVLVENSSGRVVLQRVGSVDELREISLSNRLADSVATIYFVVEGGTDKGTQYRLYASNNSALQFLFGNGYTKKQNW